MKVDENIAAFDAYLAELGMKFEAIVVGGAALVLNGTISRATEDVDVIAPDIPKEVLAASRTFANERSSTQQPLRDDWLNNGPSSLVDVLPEGWRDELRPLYQGEAITFLQLGRMDMLRTKLFAYCDRQTDLNDCVALEPTDRELRIIKPWLDAQDAHLQWPEHVKRSLRALQRELDKGMTR